MSWRCRALIDSQAWWHNLAQAKALHPHSQVMAVVKSDAYGHGLGHAVAALESAADVFAVASIEEALTARQLAPKKRICMLSQFFDIEQAVACQHYDIELVVWHVEHVHILEKLAVHKEINVWLKVDTGMGRLGVLPSEFAATIGALRALPNVKVIGVMTHFANADDKDNRLTSEQIACFKQLPIAADLSVSLANSAAVMQPLWRTQLQALRSQAVIRPGIMLTGASPFANDDERQQVNQIAALKPVMTLQARLLQIRHLPKGSAIGYGSSFFTPEAMPVGVVSIGYGDGYPRGVSTNAYVVINGKQAPIIGRISMDSLCVDLRAISDAKAQDVVTLWGESLPIEKVASFANTISYELYCRLTQRVPRIVIN